MGHFVKGDVVIIPFPFSDLSASKKRPALVLAESVPDIILAQITSKAVNDGHGISICDKDFEKGSLPVESNVRPNKLFTAESSIVLHKAGSLNSKTLESITGIVVRLLTNGR